MKFVLPEIFNKLFKPKEEVPEYILTLLLELDHVAGSLWNLTGTNKADIFSAVVRRLEKNDWKNRIEAADDIISSFEKKIGANTIKKVVFGLPIFFLTNKGDIKNEVRTELKMISSHLGLSPIGFVSTPQAITHKLKIEEGVPPSVILIGLSDNKLVIAVYKVGILQGSEVLPYDDHIVIRLEQTLKNYHEIEVLPSRMLLYGVDKIELDKLKTVFTKHPWTNRASFLHLPKIDILNMEYPVISVSHAGAFEISRKNNTILNEYNDDLRNNYIEDKIINSSKENIKLSDQKDSANIGINGQKEKDISHKDLQIDIKDEDEINEADNITFVKPEEIGFSRNTDILENPEKNSSSDIQVNTNDDLIESIKPLKSKSNTDKLNPFINIIKNLKENITQKKEIGDEKKGKNRSVVYSVLAFSLILILGLLFFILTQIFFSAKVIITIKSQELTDEIFITIDENIDSITEESKIPGKYIKTTLSGTGNAEVNGTKKIGDPARGEITVYNKSLTEKDLKKGAKLSSGSLVFTLDSDIKVASASESIGSITFGKAKAGITAVQIGTQGNLSSGAEFVFDKINTTVIIARNDESLKGGTSRDAIVVTRSDYNNLVDKLSNELLESVKTQLIQNTTGTQKLIESTIKTVVVDKKFKQELDEETNMLEGEISIEASGLTYDSLDVTRIGQKILSTKAPSGYSIKSDSISFEIGEIVINKDGTMKTAVKFSAKAIPEIDIISMKNVIAGKSQSEAFEIIKNIPGIYDINFIYSMNFGITSIPKNSNKINIEIKE